MFIIVIMFSHVNHFWSCFIIFHFHIIRECREVWVWGFPTPPRSTPRSESGIACHVGVQVQETFHRRSEVQVGSFPRRKWDRGDASKTGPQVSCFPSHKWHVPLVERLGMFTWAHWHASQNKLVKCCGPRSPLELQTLKIICGHVQEIIEGIKFPSKLGPFCARIAPN